MKNKLIVLLASLMLCFSACENKDKLSQAEMGKVCSCDTDASVIDAETLDAVSCTRPPYQPPHPMDSGIRPDSGGVPCIRWSLTGTSCWFLSGIKEETIDILCEDQLEPNAWCECLGHDWGEEQQRGLSKEQFPVCGSY